jgi:ribosomal protein S18 acetylase RimI-like enzyme
MLNHAAPHQVARTSPQGASIGTQNRTVSIWRRRCLLWQQQDLERALAHFTFIADVTTLAADCCFAGDSETLVARYDGLPFAAVAFHSRGGSTGRDMTATRIADLTRRLIAPTEAFYCLVSDEKWTTVQDAYTVLERHPEQQMVHYANPPCLDPGDVVRLSESDLPAMKSLAEREGMIAFEADPLGRGPWYGVWRNGQLAAQGGVRLLLSRAAEIGNIVTSRKHRREGLATRIVVALLAELKAQDRLAFLQVLEGNGPALSLYESLGFRRLRRMYLVRCRIQDSANLPLANSAL